MAATALRRWADVSERNSGLRVLPWLMLPAVFVAAIGVVAAWLRHPGWGIAAVAAVALAIGPFRGAFATGRVEDEREFRQHQFQRVLLELTRADDADWAALVRHAVERVSEALEIERVGVWLYNPDETAILCADVFHRHDKLHEEGFTIRVSECPAYFAALQESRALAVSDAQTDPRTREMSERYLKAIGIHAMLDVPIRRRDQLIGILCHEAEHPREWTADEQEFVASVSDRIALALEARQRRAAEAALRRANETLELKVVARTAELQVAMDKIAAEQQQVECLSRDLKARASQLESANAELQAFTYSVSHDLRAPLRAITGFAQILARRHRATLNEEGRHYLDNVIEAGQRMSRLIDDLLAYARLGRQAVRYTNVRPSELLGALARDYADRLAECGGTLHVSPELPAVNGDPTLLGQALGNLLDNAIKYRRPGIAPVIHVDGRRQGDAVTLTVCDNGLGIDPRFHEKIFQVFQRLHSVEEFPGSGIGLASTRKAVERLGGRVWVESTPGSGSRFFLELAAATDNVE